MLEKDIERKLVAGVKRAGGKAYKFVSPGNVGVPDRIVIWPNGVIHFVELKTSKGVLSRLQGVQARELQKLNQKVFDKFKTLDENEIKTLVVDGKWLSELKEQILSIVERAVQECITRISTLVARYDKTLDELTERANALSLRVKAHLEAMDKAR